MPISIGSDEYRQRLEALQAGVVEAGLDLLVVTSFESIYYLTGAGFEPLERPFFLLVRPVGPPTLLVPKLDEDHMRKARNVDRNDLRTYWDHPARTERSWPERLREEIGAVRVVGVEPSLPRSIAEELGEHELVTSHVVDRLRLVKSPAEIAMTRRAARYADLGVERLLAASYHGSTVAEGYAETRTVQGRILREVEDWDPLTSRVLMATWAAPRSAQPHSVPSLADRLESGPHVALVLTRVNGYSAESERTYFTRRPNREAVQLFETMMEARRLAFAAIRPGASGGEIDARVHEFLDAEGLGGDDARLHRVGHGIGLGTHEGPWLGEASNDRLVPGMVVSIEPGLYVAGLGGFRHSDTVLVTNRGHARLTNARDRLDNLIVDRWKPLSRIRGALVCSRLRLHRRSPGDVSSTSPRCEPAVAASS